MTKYSFEFKKKVVTTYLNRKGGYAQLAKIYGITSCNGIEKRVHNDQTFGDKGLMSSRNFFEKKLSMVKLYLSKEVSYQELAFKERITNPRM